MSTVDAKEIYEEAGALAEMLPADQRERFAALLVSITNTRNYVTNVANQAAVTRWASDAGHLKRG